MERRKVSSGHSRMGRPSIRTSPSGASQRRATRAARVVLPLPVGPTMASVEPAGIFRLMSKDGVRAIAVGLGGGAVAGDRGGKCEMEIAEFDFAGDGCVGGDFREAVVDLRLGVQNVVQAAHGGGAALENVGDPAKGDHWPDEEIEVGKESQAPTERNLVA